MKSNLEKMLSLCNNMDEDMTARFLEVMMTEQKKQILENHPHKIYETSGGRWRTQIDEKTAAGKRKILEAVSREKLEDKLFQWYLENQNASEHWIEKTVFKETTKKTEPVLNSDFSLMSFYHAFRRHHDKELKPNAVVKWDNEYNRFFKDKSFMCRDIRLTGFDEVDEFVISSIKELSLCSSPAKRLIQQLKNIFDFAFKKNVLVRNPIAGLTVKKYSNLLSESKRSKESKRQVLSDEEWDAMKTVLRSDEDKNQIGAFAVDFATMTGCRVGEIAGLEWEDIDDNEIHIRRAMIQRKEKRGHCEYYVGDVKSKKSKRSIPNMPCTKELFDRLKKITGNPSSGPVFRVLDDTGEIIHIPNHRVSSYAKNKTIQLKFSQAFGIHSIRKTFNSRMEREGVPVSLRAKLLGHDIAVNTQYYTHDTSSDEDRRNAFSAAVVG